MLVASGPEPLSENIFKQFHYTHSVIRPQRIRSHNNGVKHTPAYAEQVRTLDT